MAANPRIDSLIQAITTLCAAEDARTSAGSLLQETVLGAEPEDVLALFQALLALNVAMAPSPPSLRCIVVPAKSLTDWWLIERAEHDGREWIEETAWGGSYRRSARLGSADIEGTSAEMLALAEAIEKGESAYFKRCAAERMAHGYLLSSPRNSDAPTLVSFEHARALAADIRAKIGGEPPPTQAPRSAGEVQDG